MAERTMSEIPFHLETRVSRFSVPVSTLIASGTTSLEGTITVVYGGGSLARNGVVSRDRAGGVPNVLRLIPQVALLRMSLGRSQRTLLIDEGGRATNGGSLTLTHATGQEVLEMELDDYTLNYRSILCVPRVDLVTSDMRAADFFVLTDDEASILVPEGTWFDQLVQGTIGITSDDQVSPSDAPPFSAAFLRFSFSPPILQQIPLGLVRTEGGAQYGVTLPVDRLENTFNTETSFADVAFGVSGLPPTRALNTVIEFNHPRNAFAFHVYPVDLVLYSWAAKGMPPSPLHTLRTSTRVTRRVFVSWSPETRNWTTALSGVIALHYAFSSHRLRH